MYYENTPVSEIEPASLEGQLNPWGTYYPVGIKPSPGATTQFEVQNLTTPGMTHSSVVDWFQANALPTLTTANPFVTGPVDAPITGNAYDLSVDAGSFLADRVAYFVDLNPQLSAGSFNAQINWGDNTGPSTGLVVGIPATGYFVLGLHYYGQAGTYDYSVTIRDAGGSSTTVKGTVNVTPTQVVTGSAPGQPGLITIRQPGTGQVSQIAPYGTGYNGGINVAVADVNADGTKDIIAGAVRGGPAQVVVYDGKTLQPIRQLTPFGPTYHGGISVASGNVNNDGNADIAVVSRVGLGKLYSGSSDTPLARFRVPSAWLRRGAKVSIADLSHTGYGDVVVTSPNGRVFRLVNGQALARRQAYATVAQIRRPGTAATATLPPDSYLAGLLDLPARRGRHSG